MKRVVTFGELMLRLQPYNYERFVQCDHVEFTFGGGEANVSVSQCMKLKTINFEGTKAEWNSIEKHEKWDVNAYIEIIKCVDGDIAI